MSDYKPGKIVELGSEGKARLVRRFDSYPTRNKWAKVRWQVVFIDDKGQESKGEYFRAITEIEVPNENFPATEDYSLYQLKGVGGDSIQDYIDRANEIKAKPIKKGQGRPEGPMNELKAKNQLRAFKQGKIGSDKVADAITWLRENKFDNYLKKHYQPLTTP